MFASVGERAMLWAVTGDLSRITRYNISPVRHHFKQLFISRTRLYVVIIKDRRSFTCICLNLYRHKMVSEIHKLYREEEIKSDAAQEIRHETHPYVDLIVGAVLLT